jgi:Ca2+-transporting ATPase
MAGTGVVMAAGTLGVLAATLSVTTEERALAIAFTTFVLFQVFNALCARSETASVFSRDTLRNGKLWLALAVVVALQVAAVHVDAVQSVFGTADLTAGDWLVAIGVASTVLWFDEARKALARRRRTTMVAPEASGSAQA